MSSSIVEQVQALSFDELDKLVSALKRKPEKTPVELLTERVDELEEHLTKSERGVKELQKSVFLLVVCAFIMIFVMQQR